MAKTKISEFDTNPDNNTDINSINIAEGCAPSGINNAIRQLMSDLKEFQTGAASDPLTVGGVATFTAGSASAPAITTTGDTNTGIFFPAADTIAFAEGGAEAMRLDSSGNLGLGAAPPAWGSGIKAINIFNAGNSVQAGADYVQINQNSFFNGTSNTYVTTGTASYYQQGGGEHRWNTAPVGTAGNAITFTQAMTLDASGNLGIGATSPVGKLNVINDSTTNSDSSPTSWGMLIGRTSGNAEAVGLRVKTGAGISGTTFPAQLISSGTNLLEIFTAGAQPVVFGTGATERMRIEASGQGALLVGTSTNPASGNYKAAIVQGGFDGLYVSVNQSPGGHTIRANRLNDGDVIQIHRNGTQVGVISVSGSSTSYVTSSDYRLKENIAPMTGALAKVQALKPVIYKWKADGSDGQGFIAHELQEVCPDAVSGQKDDVDEEGNPKYQGIDTSFLVATLTAAIQEQQAIITDLKARIESLENK
jgi:hypothetical protein